MWKTMAVETSAGPFFRFSQQVAFLFHTRSVFACSLGCKGEMEGTAGKCANWREGT